MYQAKKLINVPHQDMSLNTIPNKLCTRSIFLPKINLIHWDGSEASYDHFRRYLEGKENQTDKYLDPNRRPFSHDFF